MLGYDREHPVVRGSALVSTLVPRALLEQRAWTEAMQEFRDVNLPTAATLLRLLRRHPEKNRSQFSLGLDFPRCTRFSTEANNRESGTSLDQVERARQIMVAQVIHRPQAQDPRRPDVRTGLTIDRNLVRP